MAINHFYQVKILWCSKRSFGNTYTYYTVQLEYIVLSLKCVYKCILDLCFLILIFYWQWMLYCFRWDKLKWLVVHVENYLNYEIFQIQLMYLTWINLLVNGKPNRYEKYIFCLIDVLTQQMLKRSLSTIFRLQALKLKRMIKLKNLFFYFHKSFHY